MSCQCNSDAEGPEVSQETTPRARKTYHCSECGEGIPKGERYQRIDGLWEGIWWTFRTHLVCVKIRETLCPCAPLGELNMSLIDQYGIDLVSDPTEWED